MMRGIRRWRVWIGRRRRSESQWCVRSEEEKCFYSVYRIFENGFNRRRDCYLEALDRL